MAKSAKIRPEQIERAQKLLQGLPEKDDRKTREEAAGLLEKDFRKALGKGYSPRELTAILKNAGIIIPAYLVEKFLKPETEDSHPSPKPQSAPEPEPKKKVAPRPASGQFVITPDTPLEDL